MNREVKTNLFSLLTIVVDLRNEEGALGWFMRQRIANLIGAAPTKEEVLAFLDRHHVGRALTMLQELELYTDPKLIDEFWYDVANDERPIAEFLSLWDVDGQPLGTHEAARRGPVWYITPEEYR